MNGCKNQIEIVATDLDGTLLNSSRQVSARDHETMITLGEKDICRVIATGRSLFSFRKVILPDFPIDYLVFSSGAGIMHWPTQQLIQKIDLPGERVSEMIHSLKQEKYNFMVHRPVPENHFFEYVHGLNGSESLSQSWDADFFRRVELYKDYCRPMQDSAAEFGPASQFVIIAPPEEFEISQRRKRFQTLFADTHVIRTTSPLDHHSMWLELFPSQVSKSKGLEAVCHQIGKSTGHVLAIGNDYNDLDMLHGSKYAAVVSDAPQELRNQFQVCDSNDNSGFSDAVSKFMSI